MRIKRGLTCLVAWVGLAGAMPGGVIVVPGQYTAAPGGSTNLAPFSYADTRYQQIFPGDVFPGPLTLTGMAFRPGISFLTPGDTYFDIQIDLSVTPVLPEAMDTVYANNLGPSVTTVFQANYHAVISGTIQPDGTTPFELAFPFLAPFVYDPSLGNLLFDVRIGNHLSDGAFPGMDMIYSTTFVPGRVYGNLSLSSGAMSYAGLIAQFSYSDGAVEGVPEPGTMWLTAGALGLLGWLRRMG